MQTSDNIKPIIDPTSTQSILRDLNDEQRSAVLQKDGPILIIAGAGSGKTRVLTSKIALLLHDGVAPENILAITFTKKAADEMKSRVRGMVGDAARGLSIGTFHSVFAKLLREYHKYIDFPKNYTIYDEDDSESCLKDCTGEVLFGEGWNSPETRKRLSEEDKAARKLLLSKYKPSVIHVYISRAKNDIILPEDYREDAGLMERDRKHGSPETWKIYSLYMWKCKKAGAMDFDDILIYMFKLLDEHPEIQKALGRQFRYILVDEFQDTNRVQCEIVHKLAAVHRNLCVVGDDSQSIYAFRGAKVGNMLNLKNVYDDIKTFRLETNYRSTGQIVDAANELISHNASRIPKTCRSARGEGEGITVKVLQDDREEARFVKEYISREVAGGAKYSDFAVLYRTNAQSRAVEDEMLKARVPYIVYSGLSFFQRAEVRDVLAYLRLVVNPDDDEAFKRICNKPARGISDATKTTLSVWAGKRGLSLLKAAAQASPAATGLKAAACRNLISFSDKISSLGAMTAELDAYGAAALVIENVGIKRFYEEDEGEDGASRVNNIKELLSSVSYFIQDRRAEYAAGGGKGQLKVSLVDYLEDISLLSNVDTDTRKVGEDHVSLMTSHCSKGLEFKTVFVLGCEENLFPLLKDDSTEFDVEEERRLFYVSVTRAKDKLILTTCEQRWIYGSVEPAEESRFVEELTEGAGVKKMRVPD